MKATPVEHPEQPLIEPLTRRELTILARLAENLTNPEIAAAETLALSSVKWYVQQIYSKLGVNSRKQALARARELGLVTAISPGQAQMQMERTNTHLPQGKALPTGPAYPQGTVTFLLTDIEGSTPLWERQPEKMAEALQIHNMALHQAIEANSGAVFKIVGDAFQAAFATAPQALKAAIAGQQALQSASWNELGALKVRMGLHTGEAELDPNGDEYAVSHTKNRVARIMSAAYGGQILLSQETADLVQRTLPAGVSLKDLGEHRLKGMALPEHLFQVEAVGSPQDFPPLATTITHPNNLPVRLTSFIGREKELETISSLLNQHRMVTLTGTGGTGKTRLCLQAAGMALENYPNGAWLVELAPLADPAMVPQAVASVFNLPEMPGKTVLQSVEDYLRAKRLLLILDNCEHLLDACARLADRLLRACPQLSILASSREFLGVKGEAPYRVPPMSLPDAHQLPPLEQLVSYDAVRLFVERARMISPEFTLTEKNASALIQVVSRVDGIPLAIELAAARLRVLSVEQIAGRLNDAFRLLTGGSRTVLPRHQTLRALIDWSYNLLDNPERILLRRLSVFSGGWSLEAAERVCAFEGEDCPLLCTEDILDLLSGLVDKSLIQTSSSADGSNRFRMLETIRQYAGEKLAGEKLLDERESVLVRNRHMEYYLALVEELEPRIRGREQLEVLERLEEELDNLRMALGWALETDVEAVLRMAAALRWFWHIHPHTQEGIDWLERGLSDEIRPLETMQVDEALIHAKAMEVLGFAYLMKVAVHGLEIHLEKARKLLTTSLSVYQAFHPKEHPTESREILRGTAWVLRWLSDVDWRAGKFIEANEKIREALRIFRSLGDAHGTAECLQVSGDFFNDLEQRRKIHEDQLSIQQENGDVDGIATAFFFIGGTYLGNAEYEQASNAYRESMLHYQKVNHLDMVSNSLEFMAFSALFMGNYQQADRCFKQSSAIHRELGNDTALADKLLGQCFLAVSIGDFDLAVKFNAEAQAITRRNPNQAKTRRVIFWKSRLARMGGDLHLARRYINEIASATQMSVYERIAVLWELGYIVLAEGELIHAGNLWRECIQLLRDNFLIFWFILFPLPIEALAHLAACEKKYERAARLFGSRWSRGAQNLISPVERDSRQEELAEVKTALGEERFEQLYEEGEKMTLEQTISLALEEEDD
jgi:predicted ATPase/class 3 adenylate cyclase